MFRPTTPDATRVTKNLQRGFRVGPAKKKGSGSKLSFENFLETACERQRLGNEKIFGSSRKKPPDFSCTKQQSPFQTTILRRGPASRPRGQVPGLHGSFGEGCLFGV